MSHGPNKVKRAYSLRFKLAPLVVEECTRIKVCMHYVYVYVDVFMYMYMYMALTYPLDSVVRLNPAPLPRFNFPPLRIVRLYNVTSMHRLSWVPHGRVFFRFRGKSGDWAQNSTLLERQTAALLP